MLNVLLTAVLEVLAWILLEVVLATLIRRLVFVIVRLSSRSDKVDPDGIAAITAGVLFWCVLASGGYSLYRTYFSYRLVNTRGANR